MKCITVPQYLAINGGSTTFPSLADVSNFFEISAGVINATGGLLLLIASVAAILETMNFSASKMFGKPNARLLFTAGLSSIDAIRFGLGSMITFALELLVAADVIDTLTKPAHAYKMESLYKIAMVVTIRTALSFFLGKELEELEKKLHHSNNNF